MRFAFTDRRAVAVGGQGRPDRYFSALLPDLETAHQIDERARELRARLHLRRRPVGPGKYHLSLWSLHVPDGPSSQEVAAICRASNLVRQRPFSVGFNRAASFGARADWPLVLMSTLEMPAGRSLHLAIGEALRRAGIKAGAQPFEPHVSLVYDRRRWAALAVPDLIWKVRDFALVRSADRKPYDILGCWPLEG